MAAYRRLSASPLWAAQRRFYERAGIDAWRTATVPHHVTSNVALATAYARIITGFARDTARREPLDVLELGAGSGRFAFLLLRALDTLGTPVRYLMTDVAESTIDFWRRHEALRPFVRAGHLHFARLDAALLASPAAGHDARSATPDGGSTARDGRSTARCGRPAARGGRPAAWITLRLGGRTIAPDAPVPRLVVIANYVFSGLAHDAFALRAGRVREYLVVATPGRRRDADAVSLAWRMGPPVSEPYADEPFNEVLRRRATSSGAGPVLFPVGALRTLHRLSLLADELLVLVADRGTDEIGAIAPGRDLGVARHGSISFPVDFPALREWVRLRGGHSLTPPLPEPRDGVSREPQAPLLHVAGFLLGRRRDWPATRRAHRSTMRGGGPAALYGQRRALAAGGHPRTPGALLEIMRRCGPDPRVVAECVRPLWPHLVDAGPRLRRDITRAVLAAWPNHYNLGDEHDIAFDLGLLLYAARSYVGARDLFEASRRLHGEDAATWWNLGLCHVALGRPHAARSAFRRAHRLAPGRHAAGLATVKAARASQPGRRSRRATGD